MSSPALHARQATLMIACGGLIYGLIMGVRSSLSLFIGPINTASGLGLASISLAFGIAQLMWGVTQPVAGVLASRYGNARIMVTGALMVAAGTALVPFATSQWMLILAIAVLGSGGAGFAGPSMIMAALNQKLPAARRAMANAMVNVGGSLGQFLVVPAAQMIAAGAGWVNTLILLGGTLIAIVPLSRTLWVPATASLAPAAGDVKVADALRDRNFPLIAAGFFVCGFHVAFISTHLPGVVAACGLPPEVGAWSLGVVGLFNIAGSFGIGWAIGRWRSRSLLSLIYASRGAIVAVFLVAPKTELTFVLFSAAIGLTYLSTVPATATLVSKFYGVRNMATLFGFVMLSHQVGGFLGAWLGGKAFVASGSYDWMWYADIALAIFAALVHLPIREAPVRAPAASAA